MKRQNFECGCVIDFDEDKAEGKVIYMCDECKEENLK